MQPRVSMVIPCYNKEKYIGNMFDSILDQKWDNIELVIVNDGSNDGSRDVIAYYKPKFLARGFKSVVIDQDNQGVAAAVRNGLMHITGDFLCQVDADDELDPEYVSTMAGWLAENPDYDWAACDLIKIKNNSASYVHTFPLGAEIDCKIEKWILQKIQLSVCIYMVRTSYFRQCDILKSYYIGREGPQEAQIFLPLALGAGKIKYFPAPLYKYLFDFSETHHSYYTDRQESNKIRFSNWYIPVKETIHKLPIEVEAKQRLHCMAEIGILKNTFFNEENPSLEEFKQSFENLMSPFHSCFPLDFEISIENIHDPKMFFVALQDNLLNIQPKPVKIPDGRIIAWGAMGKNARGLLPCLVGTSLNPTELWDSAGDGIAIKKPDLASLTANDFILVLPLFPGNICAALEDAGFTNIIFFEDILTYAASCKFPEFYNGCVRFSP